MSIPYRVQRGIKRTVVVILVLILLAVLAWACWLIWLGRYVVYTEDGAVFDFNLPAQLQTGEVAVPPTNETVPIYYNDGENALNTSTELTQMMGYYVDTEALQAGISQVRAQIQALPPQTPVMVDVKSIYGSFFYSSDIEDKRASGIDPSEMDSLISFLKNSGMYTIARFPALKDYEYGLNNVPDGMPMAGGYLWMDEDGCYWLNPGSQGTISFLVQIISELKALGFDEVVLGEFEIPTNPGIVFNADRAKTLADAASVLVSTCATDSFAVSFSSSVSLTLPAGRTRLYLEDVEPSAAANLAEQAGLENPQIQLVFVTELHDTRFDTFSVLRPLDAAH